MRRRRWAPGRADASEGAFTAAKPPGWRSGGAACCVWLRPALLSGTVPLRHPDGYPRNAAVGTDVAMSPKDCGGDGAAGCVPDFQNPVLGNPARISDFHRLRC